MYCTVHSMVRPITKYPKFADIICSYCAVPRGRNTTDDKEGKIGEAQQPQIDGVQKALKQKPHQSESASS